MKGATLIPERYFHAYTAMLAAAPPPLQAETVADWVMVPCEPTNAMREAYRMYGDTSDWWNAVVSAAPKQPQSAEAEVAALRYFANGPEGSFTTDSAEFAEKLIGLFDREEWTVTDMEDANPQPPAASVVEAHAREGTARNDDWLQSDWMDECRQRQGQRQILLRCPDCKREMMVNRHYKDYPEAVRVEVRCDNCCDGGFEEMYYYDEAGNHIVRDDSKQPQASVEDVEAQAGRPVPGGSRAA